ncbi:MAG: 4Fe-4S dicluster domain-containing protein [bacterium]
MSKFISKDNFIKLLDNLQTDYKVFVPVKKGDQRFYIKYTSYIDTIVIGEVRAFEPLKSFFTRAREKVASGFSSDIPKKEDKPYAVIGVKACDLKGFKVQDHVFLNSDCQDPLYKKTRAENLIISADCTCAIDTCFCLALGVKPTPQENFDINISDIGNGFIVDSGSPKGEELLKKHAPFFQEAQKELLARRDSMRSETLKQVESNIKNNAVPKQDQYKNIIDKNFESNIWEKEASNCVECAACNAICPTCHCFLLYDRKNETNMERLKVWDSCMVKDFARVAGGANPRKQLWMRLRNRFEKKFDFFPKVAEVYACTGCGRCISACPAKIDIRSVLKKLVQNV